jgi:hypothetical protein
MPNDDPTFPNPVRAMRGSRPYIFKTVGGAIDFVNDGLEDPERARPHWGQARWVLYEAYPDDAIGMARPGPDKIKAAEDARLEERGLASRPASAATLLGQFAT